MDDTCAARFGTLPVHIAKGTFGNQQGKPGVQAIYKLCLQALGYTCTISLVETADHQRELTATEQETYFPPCPYLPPPIGHMDYRSLRNLKGRDAELFPVALSYGHYLWQKGLPARAILALARAIYCDLDGSEPILDQYPIPYRPLRWIIQHYDDHSGRFMGNPRLSFQHQALRLRGARREQRSWRAWAVNCVARQARPALQPDPKIRLGEPTADEIAAALTRHGIPNETSMFMTALQDTPLPNPTRSNAT